MTMKYPMVERAVRWLLIMLMVEFVLGVFLTTVISYEPNKHSAMQATFLVLHAVVGIVLLVGSTAHIFTSRRSHLLGAKPVAGLVAIIGAFIAGGIAANNGSNIAVLLMALFFGAAIGIYGRSYLTVKLADGK